MNKNLNHYEIANATDVGMVRKVNEDYYGAKETLNGEVVVVCDGMGGHAGGETASRLAVESIIASLNSKLSADPLNALNEALLYANQVILDYALQHPELKGMGTTCVVLLLKDNCGYYAHVGDSRIYLYTNNHLHQLTKDHSFVQSLIEAGAISSQDAESHPRKNEITNALGLERMQPPTLCQNPCKPRQGDILLLCSDGLTGMVTDAQIKELLGSKKVLYDKAKELVQLANSAGGIDNITLQLVQFSGSGFAKSRKGLSAKVNKRVLLVAGVALLALSLLGAIVVMASGGFFGNGIAQTIAPFFHCENVAAPSKTAPAIKAVSPAPNAEKDSLQAVLTKTQRELEAQRVQQKEKDAQQAAALAKAKSDRDEALLKANKEADAHRTETGVQAPGEAKVIKIGQEYGGGIVFYVDATGKHGLIAAKSDLTARSVATDEKLSGLYSWADAKAACNAFVIGDYGNWRLPSREELKKLLLKKSVVGGFRKGTYWSFSEKDGLNALIQDFGNGKELNDKKTTTHRVRLIRSF
jgi:serine/threonine protein phosphatase PrpC